MRNAELNQYAFQMWNSMSTMRSEYFPDRIHFDQEMTNFKFTSIFTSLKWKVDSLRNSAGKRFEGPCYKQRNLSV